MREVDFKKKDGKHTDRIYDTPQWFACLIRRGESVDRQCPACNEEAVPVGWKVCRGCAYEAVQEMRKAARR